MLQQVLQTIHNYFFKPADVHPGAWTIAADGTIPGAEALLKDGQRFWIMGSDLNDGVYTWHPHGIANDDDNAAAPLAPETFNGSLCILKLPPGFLALVEEISAWEEKNADALASPFTSENVIGVYSYTKATGGSGAGGTVTWRDAFRERLKPYRKLVGP